MTAKIIDGKMISAEVNRENAEKVAFLKSKNITPGTEKNTLKVEIEKNTYPLQLPS